MTQPSLPQPQLNPTGITSDQYFHYTPEKLELAKGHLGYGGQDQTGFHLAVLTNMGLLSAIRHTGVSLWIEALDSYLRSQLATLDAEPEIAEALLNRLNRAMIELEAVVDSLEEENE